MAKKITEIAKSFDLKTKDVIDWMKPYGSEKKAGAALDELELDIFLQTMTLANQLENIKDYVSGAAKLISDAPKPAPKPAEAKPEPKPAPKPAEAKPAPKPAEAKPAPNPVPGAEGKPVRPRPEERARAAAPVRAGEPPRRPVQGGIGTRDARGSAQPQRRPGQGPQKPLGVNRDDIERRMREFREQQSKQSAREEELRREMRSRRDAERRAEAERRAAEEAQRAKARAAETPAAAKAAAKAERAQSAAVQQTRKEVKPLQKKAPVDRFSGFETSKLQSGAQKPQPKKDEGREGKQNSKRIVLTGGAGDGAGEVIAAAAPKTRIVDTRTTSVDLSKYDERIEGTYSGHSDNRAGKQKIKKQDTRLQGKSAKEKERMAHEKMRKMQEELARKKPLSITVPDEITVGELATRLKKTAAEVVKHLMMLGVMASVNQTIDYDTAYLVAEELGAKVTREVVVTIEERLFDDSADAEADLIRRSPVVCVMGHVDHGKTSLLDAIRHTSVTKGEAGGITQHIGAYRVRIGDNDLTFLDTPGHEAFTAMRARGAQATDIAILVVAADDGIMPQTIEAINHAKAAGIDIVVAINKMDKPQANPDQVKQELTKYELVPEEWGGDVICVPVSALTGSGIEDLLESVLLVAEMKELRANPNRRAKGLVIESRLDRGRGPVATVLVQNGTLHHGDIVIAGTAVGRVRAMIDDKGRTIKEAGPSVPVEIIGLSEVPVAGDELAAVEDEKMARSLAEQRRDRAKQEEFKANSRANLDDLFAQIGEGTKKLDIIVKADVDGSAEAVKASLLKLSTEEVRVSVIHAAVGGITENDVMLAAASNAIIVGFNVRPDKAAIDSAERQGVDIRTYRIIYDCIEEITAAMKGMLAPKFREALLGHAEVRATIRVPNVGTIAGSYVQDGKITRNASIRIVRDGIVIAEDKIGSLRRFKDDVREVAQGYECGVGLERFNDIKEGDILEAYVMEEIKE